MPYYVTQQALVTFADSEFAGVTTLEELASARLGAQIGTTSLDFIDNGFLTDQVIEWWHEPAKTPVDRDDQTDALDDISASDVDELADRLFVDGARIEIVRVPVG